MSTRSNQRTLRVICIFALGVGFVLFWASPTLATTYYVKVGGTGDGTSWASAYGDLQDGLDASGSDDEIWVAAGTYYPTYDYGLGIGDRGKHFRMINLVGIYGGFEAAGDPGWNDRNPSMYETILNGDPTGGDPSDGNYHVFYHPFDTDLDHTAILDGFTIMKGLANGSGDHGAGGGMFNNYSSPTVTNCRFTNNSAPGTGGGGMYNAFNSPMVTNCTFFDNGASDGGGIYNHFFSYTEVTNCTFNYNFGGGMFNTYIESYVIVTNCILWGNMPGQIIDNDNTLVTYSNVQGGYTGTGNIDTDPLFVGGSDLRLQASSPCIDAGNNDSVPEGITIDLDGLPRIVNAVVDMGAYENQELVVICVDTNAAGANSGINWFDAFNHLQDGLAAADYGDTILVAEGTYRPDEDTADPTGTNLRTDTFALTSGVALYGGFPTGGSDFANRNPNQYETILSGDIGAQGVNTDNSYHVVTGSGTDNTAVLDGFTISGGNADGSAPFERGGGIYNDGGSPKLSSCKLTNNFAANWGGGIANNNASSPILVNCQLIGNVSNNSAGGIFNYSASNPVMTNCWFIGNTAASSGGAIYNFDSTVTLTNSVFSGNTATSFHGGAIFNYGFSGGSIANVTSCSFSQNSAGFYGGGIYNYSSESYLTNCVLWGNTDGGPTDQSSQIYLDTSIVTIDLSCVQGWDGSLGGGGNIGADPIFKDADGADDIVGTEDDNLELSAGSPCIDAGDSFSLPLDTYDLDGDGDTAERIPLDLAGRDRYTDDPVTPDTGTATYPVVDMGAYERYEFCGGAGFPYPRSDANQDCRVNLADLAIMAMEWFLYTGPE